MELSNSTEYYLSSEGYYPAWGYVESPPVGVSPGKKSGFVARKTSFAATGTTGVAVWRIGDTSTRLVVMWSAPWNHNHHRNVLAVGFKENTVSLNTNIYKEMYYDKHEKWFSRRQYNKDKGCPTVTMKHSSGDFKVTGSMGTSHKCEAKIELLPLRMDVAADSLRSVVFGNN